MKALIAAGGHATRLRPITHTTNKHLIPLAGKPLIEYAIEKIAECGVKEIAINVNPGEMEIQKVVGDGSRWGVHVTYLEQSGGPKGLAHIVSNAHAWIGNEPFAFYLGDNIILGSIVHLKNKFESDDLDCLLALARVPDARAFGCPVLEGDRIVKVIEKPQDPPSPYAVTGIYFYKPCIFDAIEGLAPSARGEYEISDAHTRLIEMGKKVGYEEITGWWKDTGKPDDLIEGNGFILDLIKASDVSPEAIIEPGAVIDGIVKIGAGTNVSKNSVIRGPVTIGSRCTINGAVIGPYVSISDDSTIERTRIERSIVMEEASISSERHIVRSIIGKRVSISDRERSDEAGLRFLIGDQSLVEL
jgi:glucose-1-phosphate thymidylyltransferase